MPRIIHKYPLDNRKLDQKEPLVITTGRDPVVIHVGARPSRAGIPDPWVWIGVEEGTEGQGSVTLHCLATGDLLPSNTVQHVGTIVDGFNRLAYHWYQELHHVD